MKGSALYINRSQFRFRRWSRNGWAVFASLKRAVSIGNLALLMIPGTILLEKVHAFFNINADNDGDEECCDLPEELSLMQEFMPVVATTAIPANQNYINILLTKRLMQLMLSQPFLFMVKK